MGLFGGNDSAPQYQAPPPSPEETALAQQTALQNQQATQADARADTARLMAIYGTRLAMAGQTSSPLINAPVMRAPGGGTNVDVFTPQAAGVF